MHGATVLPLVLFAAWWPFGEPAVRDDDPTLGSLGDRSVAVDPDRPVQADEALARENYRAFLELAAGDPLLRGEALRRLADLELEADDASAPGPAPAGYDDAIALYTTLLATYPDHPGNDRVLYQLARAYETAGQAAAALATLDRLVSGWPQTAHLAEAQFRRGEILFVDKRYAEAQAAYAAVVAQGAQAAFYEQSLYKLGWSQFKQGSHAESLDAFFGVLDRKLVAADGAAIEPDNLERAERELVDDTLRAVSIGCSYLDGPRSLDDWFRTHDAPYAHVVYTGLGDLYVAKERYTDAAETYAAYAARDPWHAEAPLLQAKAVRAYGQGGFSELVIEGKQAFVERYGIDSPFWSRHAAAGQPEVRAALAADLEDLARHFHARAQASGQAEDYARAARWYREHLRAFPADEDAAQTNFLLAEILFESGRLDEAAIEYERTAYERGPHERAAEAGYAALLAHAGQREMLADAGEAALHRASIDSALRFSAAFPEHPQAAAVLTRAAQDLFALGELERAAEVGAQVVAREPTVGDDLARTAWTVIAHARFDLGQFGEAEAAYLRVREHVPADHADRGEIEERLAASIYRQAEQRRAGGDLDGAVTDFLRVAQAAPGSAARSAAEFDAATGLMELEDWARAIGVLETFRRAHPQHELGGEVTRRLAVAYLADGQDLRAAVELERMAADSTVPDAQAREALAQAAELFAGAGEPARAAAAWEAYVTRYPKPLQAAMEGRQRLAELALTTGDTAARRRWLEALVEADAGGGGERDARSRYLAAHAALALAEPSREAFFAMRLTIPLAKSLERKQARMEAALDAYARAADYDVAGVTTAATFRIAELYHRLGSDLLASERPTDLGPDALEQYDILLEEQAYPFEEKAIELHQANAARARDGAWDDWVRRSYAALAELLPVRYAKAEIGEEVVHAIR